MKTLTTATTLGLTLMVAACAEQQESPDDRVVNTTENTPTVEVEEAPQPSVQALPTPAIESKQAVAKLSRREMAHTSADMAVGGMAYHQPMPHPYQPQVVDRENYLHYEQNAVKVVSEEPLSTFSVDVDTAGYANVRRMLSREGRLPPSDAVRLEEMINYFSYSYEVPASTEQPFSINTELAPAPWSDGHHLLQIGLKGFEPQLEQRPPANLVFLIDVSGSMRSPDKLGLVKKSLRLLVNRMKAEDHIALAVYAGAAGTVLESTPGNEKAKIMSAIDNLQAGGSTHGSAGIKLAYALAEQNLVKGGINRVVIASDGDMNVGTVNIEALKDLVERKRESGIALTTLGFGTGNYNYALMEQLADVGNGNAAYIDSLKEAQKVLVNEMQSTLMTIASDVKIQVEFNPALVSEYRLIGYENRMLNREDFTNDKVDAGDIGAGHTVTALYEIVLANEDGRRVPQLRYSKRDEQLSNSSAELAYVKLRYKQPGEAKSIETARAIPATAITQSIDESSDDLRFAASVAGFGQLLQGGQYTGQWSYDDALELARNSRGQDLHGYRSEFVHLIELAQSLSSGS
jgi:Ca-activated chloride channel family protein